MNVVSFNGRCPACVFQSFFFLLLILWFDIYALTLSNVALFSLNYILLSFSLIPVFLPFLYLFVWSCNLTMQGDND